METVRRPPSKTAATLGCVSPLLMASNCVLAGAGQLDGVLDSDGCLDLLLRNTLSSRLLVALFLPCSLIRKAFCSPTWLQELASQHLGTWMPLSCHPRGLQSMFPFVAVGFINQGTRTGMSAQWLQLFLVSLWGAWRDYCDVTSSFQEHLIRVGLCCPLCGFHLLDRPAPISTRFLFFPYPFRATLQTSYIYSENHTWISPNDVVRKSNFNL